VYWEDQPSVKICRQNFSGIPFVVLGQKVYDCQFGKNRKEKRRRMRDEKRNRVNMHIINTLSILFGIHILDKILLKYPSFHLKLVKHYPVGQFLCIKSY
jgi:hypothetical protein